MAFSDRLSVLTFRSVLSPAISSFGWFLRVRLYAVAGYTPDEQCGRRIRGQRGRGHGEFRRGGAISGHGGRTCPTLCSALAIREDAKRCGRRSTARERAQLQLLAAGWMGEGRGDGEKKKGAADHWPISRFLFLLFSPC